MLKNVELAAPCSVRWDEMTGDDRVRLCGLCNLNVHNISNMTEAEAETLLQTGGKVCVVFFRRTDGTILTKNCPVGLAKLRDAARRGTDIAATFLAVLLSISAAKASGTVKHYLHGKCEINTRPRPVHGVVEPVPLLPNNKNAQNLLPGQMLPRLKFEPEEELKQATLRYKECSRAYGETDKRTLQALQGSAYYLAYVNKYDEAAKQYEKLIALYDEATPKNVRIITYERYRSLLIQLKRNLEIPAVDATLLLLNGKVDSEAEPRISPVSTEE